MSTRQLQIFFVALVLFSYGCFVVKPPRPAATSSAFHNQTQNFHLDIKRIAIEKGCTVEGSSSGESSGGGSNGLHSQRNFHVELRGSKQALDQLMPALQAELERLARSTGASIGAAGKDAAAESQLRGFHFDYASGAARGQVSAKLEGGPESCKLSLEMQEESP